MNETLADTSAPVPGPHGLFRDVTNPGPAKPLVPWPESPSQLRGRPSQGAGPRQGPAALSWRDPRLSYHHLWDWVTSLEARSVLPRVSPLVPSLSCLLFQVTVVQIIFVLFLTSLEAARLSVPQREGRWLGFSQPQGASCRAFLGLFFAVKDFPGGTSGKEPPCQSRRHKRQVFGVWVGKIPWRRKWQPTPVFLPGESHGERSLQGSSAWG